MVKYFRFPTLSNKWFQLTQKEETVEEINIYAEENGLKVIQI